ncbi:hypothetical protein TRVA0_053S00584 [Trichomonascus vanleenenianus]|uniref:Rrn11p n=1 Tax=Trichomonascus vanleenenianus TaxID=2268995 RepID=UPI003ECB4954
MFEAPVFPATQYRASSSHTSLKTRYIFDEKSEINAISDHDAAAQNPDLHTTKLVASQIAHTQASQSKGNLERTTIAPVSQKSHSRPSRQRNSGIKLVKNTRKRRRQTSQEPSIPSSSVPGSPYIEGSPVVGELEYRGLASKARYGTDATLKSNPLQNPALIVDEEGPSTPVRSRSGGPFGHLKRYDVEMAGMDVLPRPITPLRIVRDSPSTTALSELSAQAKRVVKKNNVPKDSDTSVLVLESKNFYLGTGLDAAHSDKVGVEDSWVYRSLRIRHSQIVSTILHRGMLKNDYRLASRAFALLVRTPMVDLRVVWTIGLELLVWRRETRERDELELNSPEFDYNVHTLPHNRSSNRKAEDEEFLQWLIVNYPHNTRIRPAQWKKRPRAPQIYPYLILSKLRHSDPRSALDKLQELMLESPYSEDPIYYAYCGIATIQLLGMEPKNSPKIPQLVEKVRGYFNDCIYHGGVLPMDFLSFELERFERGEESEEDEDEDMIKNDSDEESKIYDKHDDDDNEHYKFDENMITNRGYYSDDDD